PCAELFDRQLELMRGYIDQRAERAVEIVSQIGFPIDYFGMILGLNGPRNRYTLELITITQVLASHVAMVVKHHLACRRPDRIGALMMPPIVTPGHGTFPSAHATEAFAVAQVLDGLLNVVPDHYPDADTRKSLIWKQAERIAINRTVAGVHFPIDTWAGAALGSVVGRLVLAKCDVLKEVGGFSYTAKDGDFRLHDFMRHPEAHGV